MSPSAFQLTSRLTLKEHWDLSRAARMGKQTVKDTVNRTCIQNQYVGPAALVQPVQWLAKELQSAVSDEGHHCLGQDPDQVLILRLFFQGSPAESQDFPSMVNRLQGLSLAAKQEFTSTKSIQH